MKRSILPSLKKAHSLFLTFLSLALSLCNIKFDFDKFYVLPTECILCFLWSSKLTAICTFYNINWLVFYSRDEECLLHGSQWLLIRNRFHLGWSSWMWHVYQRHLILVLQSVRDCTQLRNIHKEVEIHVFCHYTEPAVQRVTCCGYVPCTIRTLYLHQGHATGTMAHCKYRSGHKLIFVSYKRLLISKRYVLGKCFTDDVSMLSNHTTFQALSKCR